MGELKDNIVIENFLLKSFSDRLQSLITSNQIDWYWENKTVDFATDDNFMFTHTIYNKFKNERSKWLPIFEPILYFIKEKIDFKDFIRMKMNLYVNRGKQYEHQKHTDVIDTKTKKTLDNLKTCIYHFTDCDGYTKIGKEKIKSKQNQIIIFDGRKEHCGATPTDTRNRVVLNINVV